MNDEGYRKYESFFERQPLLVLEWNDSETDSVGWLVINSLRGGAAGGGTRMREKATKEECIFLAKTMEIKFQISGPPIGGAKSVIKVNFDPRDSNNQAKKRGVLKRWYQSIGPYLLNCYGTGGDLNVNDAKEVIPLTQELLDIQHPQQGVVRGHYKYSEGDFKVILNQLRDGGNCEVRLPDIAPTTKRFTVDDMITGFGLSRSLHHFYQFRGDTLMGKRVLIEGFGAVGGAAAYYLARAGAKVVGILSLANGAGDNYRSWAINADGLDVNSLLARREFGSLPSDCKLGSDEEANEFWNTEADVFIPAAKSNTVDKKVLGQLKASGVQVIACGANNPFYIEDPPDRSSFKDIGEMVKHALKIQRLADEEFTIIPDFIANCGTAREFAYLMQSDAKVEANSIFEDVDETIRRKVHELLTNYDQSTGLLNHAYSLYIPEQVRP